ncbi:MAG: hypothetical protein AB7K24_06755 [Gemmataceae bacterium]
MQIANKYINKLAMLKQEPYGTARCPHCRCYTKAMVRRSRLSNYICFSLLGAVLAGILAMIANFIFKGAFAYLLAFVATALGGLAGLVVGIFSALDDNPHADEDARSLSDQAFLDMVSSPNKQGHPLLNWLRKSGESMEGMPIMLGLTDHVEPALQWQQYPQN